MKNPLNKRILRQLRTDWRKYLVLFLLLALTIGFVSGMFVANSSMERAALEAYDKYSIEDGHFELDHEATPELIAAFEARGVTVYEQFYKEVSEGTDAKARVFVLRESVNLLCLMQGRLPETDEELVIDRMHADNAGLSVGDALELGGVRFTVVGLVAFSDYSTLFESNTDTMFNALTFDAAAATRGGFERLSAPLKYQYAFTYDAPPETTEQQKVLADALGEKLAVLAATGGMLDSADEAEALRDETDGLIAYLEGIGERAEALTARSDALNERMAAMTPEELYLHADELQSEAAEIQAEADALEAERPRVEAAQARLEELEPYEDNINELTDFVPEYANRAIHFAPDDFGSDKARGEVLLLIFVIVLAFIFAITAANTIAREAAVIGTLRASGYTKGEMLSHYVALPLTVTLLAAAVGNLLGYFVFKNTVVAMYYHSYSLPTYVTRWNADAFLMTTVWPVLIMVAINILVVWRKLRFSPLKFLRRELTVKKNRKAPRLPRIGFMGRFRLRILIAGAAGYLTLFLGVFFVMVLLAFSVGMPATLRHYQEHAAAYVPAAYQYVLKSTEDDEGSELSPAAASAEKFSLYGLRTVDGVHVGEEVSVYGYMPGTRFSLPDTLPEGDAYVSDSFAEKFSLREGGSVTLKERYTAKTYSFRIAGTCDMPGSVALFIPNEAFNRLFGFDEGSFTGFFSDEALTDLPAENVAAVVTVDDALKVAKQLDHSMGSYMIYFSVICVLAAMLVMFLLTKLIIERNTVSISMVKVLGYTNGEISRLYVLLTTAVVVVSAVVSAFLSRFAVNAAWRMVMSRMNGWFEFYLGAKEIVSIILAVILAYLVVSLFDMRRIRRIPMSEALKTVE